MSHFNFLHILSFSPAFYLSFLGTKDIVALDSVCLSRAIRDQFLTLLQGTTFAQLVCTELAASWVIKRKVLPEIVRVGSLTTMADATLLTEVTSSVRELHVETNVSLDVLRTIFRFCLNLRKVVWLSAPAMGDDPADYFLLADKCPFLTELSINYPGFRLADFQTLLSKCKNVISIELADCPELVAGKALQSVVALGPRLQSLTFNESNTVSEGVLGQLAMQCPNLTSLSIIEGIWHPAMTGYMGLEYVPVFPTGFAAFAQCCSSLTTLHLQTTHTDFSDMQTLLQRCVHLKDLTLYQYTCENGPVDWFQQLVAVLPSELRLINLSTTVISNADVSALCVRCSHLISINIEHILNITAATSVFIVEHCRSLLHLHWASTDTTNTHMFENIAQRRPQLHTLANKFVAITRSTVLEITSLCSGLVELTFAPGETLHFRPHLPCLQRLEMRFPSAVALEVDPTILSFVSSCAQLRGVRVFQSHKICADTAIMCAIEANCPHFNNFYMLGFCTADFYDALLRLQRSRADKKVSFMFNANKRAARLGIW